jgi:hypothetical protein
MRRLIFLVGLIALIACGTNKSGRPATVAQPAMNVELTHDIFFGSGATAPATVQVTVMNRATVPILLRRVELSSPGMVQYAIYPTAREFRETILPGETNSVSVFATA